MPYRAVSLFVELMTLLAANFASSKLPAKQLLRRSRRQTGFLDRIIAFDETWFCCYDSELKGQSVSRLAPSRLTASIKVLPESFTMQWNSYWLQLTKAVEFFYHTSCQLAKQWMHHFTGINLAIIRDAGTGLGEGEQECRERAHLEIIWKIFKSFAQSMCLAPAGKAALQSRARLTNVQYVQLRARPHHRSGPY